MQGEDGVGDAGAQDERGGVAGGGDARWAPGRRADSTMLMKRPTGERRRDTDGVGGDFGFDGGEGGVVGEVGGVARAPAATEASMMPASEPEMTRRQLPTTPEYMVKPSSP